ncbi:hypothetical protein FOA52_002188 [Chlamydomonas sp. UWO 241]|nr:hypothetical protein FOA52_002188 [Chlamydomonas sp. UWO 241]
MSSLSLQLLPLLTLCFVLLGSVGAQDLSGTRLRLVNPTLTISNAPGSLSTENSFFVDNYQLDFLYLGETPVVSRMRTITFLLSTSSGVRPDITLPAFNALWFNKDSPGGANSGTTMENYYQTCSYGGGGNDGGGGRGCGRSNGGGGGGGRPRRRQGWGQGRERHG